MATDGSRSTAVARGYSRKAAWLATQNSHPFRSVQETPSLDVIEETKEGRERNQFDFSRRHFDGGIVRGGTTSILRASEGSDIPSKVAAPIRPRGWRLPAPGSPRPARMAKLRLSLSSRLKLLLNSSSDPSPGATRKGHLVRPTQPAILFLLPLLVSGGVAYLDCTSSRGVRHTNHYILRPGRSHQHRGAAPVGAIYSRSDIAGRHSPLASLWMASLKANHHLFLGLATRGDKPFRPTRQSARRSGSLMKRVGGLICQSQTRLFALAPQVPGPCITFHVDPRLLDNILSS